MIVGPRCSSWYSGPAGGTESPPHREKSTRTGYRPPRRAPSERLRKWQSPPSILSSPFSFNNWLHKTPSVEEARPAQCPCCGRASRPVGQKLNLQGHGQRERQVRGPLRPGGKPVQVLLTLRRYRCRSCRATMTVGPLGLWTRLLFSAAAAGLALCLWGLDKQKEAQVYAQCNDWSRPLEQPGPRWRQPGRWVQGVLEGRLWRGLLRGSPPQSLRAVAERVAAALAARCPPSLWEAPMAQQVFAGAALAW
jgi:zinc-finger of transposase IS204/IS1001/IS1096/IS1165